MKTFLFSVFVVSVCLTACSHKPVSESAITVQDTAYASDDMQRNYYKEVMLEDPIVYYSLHYFSDSLAGDSFVVEIPDGNIIGSSYYVQVFNAAGQRLFIDSVSTYRVFNSISLEHDSVTEEQLLSMLDRYLADAVSSSQFSESGKVEAIKNAGASEIRNMMGWNEAIADANTPIFTYAVEGGLAQLSYSHKLNKAVIIVETYEEYEGD